MKCVSNIRNMIKIHNEENIIKYGSNAAIMIELLRQTMCVEETDFVHIDYNQFYVEHPKLDYQFFKRCLKRLRMEGLIQWQRKEKKTYVKVIDHKIFDKEKKIEIRYEKGYPEKQRFNFRELPFYKGFPGVLRSFEDLLRRKREAGEYLSEKQINDLAESIMIDSKNNPQLAKKIISEYL